MISESIQIIRAIIRRESNKGQKIKRLLLAIGWQVWKRTVKKPLQASLAVNRYKFILHPDCITSSNIVYFRDADFREADFLRKHINGGTIIDVGANVGLVTLSLADRLDHAILFEPNPIAAQRAKENLALNSLSFEVCNIALSDAEGEIFLEDVGGPSGINRTIRDPAQTPHPILKVPRTSLDIFLKSRSKTIQHISMVKIDVEGHENAVLAGMRETLSQNRPFIIMFEYLGRTNFNTVKELFDSVGYRIYKLVDNSKLSPLSGEPQPLQNLFAFPREKRP